MAELPIIFQEHACPMGKAGMSSIRFYHQQLVQPEVSGIPDSRAWISHEAVNCRF